MRVCVGVCADVCIHLEYARSLAQTPCTWSLMEYDAQGRVHVLTYAPPFAAFAHLDMGFLGM